MEAKEILKELVKFNTFRDKENQKILKYIQNLLEKNGFKTRYLSKCLIMEIGEESNIGFMGHTDTVRGGKDWKYNPLDLTEVDNKLYGLGACDMKGSIAAIIKAVLDTDWNKLNYGITLFFTYDEEIGFRGIKEINNLNIKLPETMIIGEPTNNRIMNGSKGLIELKFEFKGKLAHSSDPEKGINAIEECIKFLNELRKFHNELKIEVDNKFEIPYLTMNIGKIRGGRCINTVPDKCVVYIDFRIINNKHRIKIFEKISQLKKEYKFEIEIINDIKTFISDKGEWKTTNFITEASFINSKNKYILGVGPINSHQADEFIKIESLNKLVEQYKKIINDKCL